MNNISIQRLLKGLKRTGVKIKDLADSAGIKVSLLYSISSGRATAKDTEFYLRQVIMANYPEELERIEKLVELEVI